MKLPLFLISVALFAQPLAAANARQPNIIFVLTDDLGYGDVGVFFQNARRSTNARQEPWHLTPHLDQMAADGMQLRHHYCPAPVCAPSRASLLTGVHQGHANVRDNQFDKALEDNHTLASILKGAGYATAAIGKWGLQGAGEAQAPNWPAHPLARGFDYYYGYIRHKDGHAHYPKEDGKQVWENRQEVSASLDGCYTTDLFSAKAKHWITKHRETQPDAPFFLYLAYDTPHAKLQLPPGAYPQGEGLKGGLQWIGRPGEMINAATGKPDSYIHPDYANSTWDNDRDPSTPEVAWPDVYQRYATNVRRIDDCLGDLTALLKDLSIDQDTLVVFTSDNGPSRESYLPEKYEPTFFKSFGPFDGIKRDVLEGGIRVGAIVKWPAGIRSQQVSDSPSQFHDWMPTFADVAGLPAPARSDGVSLVPTLTGKGVQRPSTVYVEYFEANKTPQYEAFAINRRGRERKQMQAIRLGEYMGIRYGIQAHSDPFEIYNVIRDPKELNNLAADRADLQEAMAQEVLRIRRPGANVKRPYDEEPVPALAKPSEVSWQWSAYARQTEWVSNRDGSTPLATGTLASPSESPAFPAGTAAVTLTGTLEIPSPGLYRVTLKGASKAVLKLHGATVIDADRGAETESRAGSIRLAAGHHPFRLYTQTTPERQEFPAFTWARAD